jgi:hypothetical protein
MDLNFIDFGVKEYFYYTENKKKNINTPIGIFSWPMDQ